MEVHKYTDIVPVTLADAVTEGRMVVSTQYGYREPRSSGEAALARYVVAWPVDNRQPPIFQSYPSYTQALRYGFDQATNLPHTTTLYYTWPGLMSEAQAIPSGTDALAYAKGEFTVGSGEWVYSASVVPGSELEVTTDGTGKLQLKSGGTAVAICTAKDTFLKTLRFRTYGDG